MHRLGYQLKPAFPRLRHLRIRLFGPKGETAFLLDSRMLRLRMWQGLS
jgi:hypothetical protein